MSIFSQIFGSGTPAPAPTTAPAPAPAPAQEQAAPGNIPAAPAVVATPENPSAPEPLAEFKDLWAPTENPAVPNASLFSGIDPNKIMEAAKGTDFTKLITQESLQAIGQGGDAAMAAFSQSLNQVAQGVYAQSAMATTKIVEAALAKQRESLDSELPGLYKKHAVSDALRSDNPVFNNPAVQPIIAALEAQLSLKYPQATTSELRTQAQKYVEALGGALNPTTANQPNPATTQAKANEPDWSTFL